MGSQNDLKLMFMHSNEFEGGKAIRGAFLTTDGRTKPLEFRCTTPIVPTQLQKILYGAFLQRHILVKLIGLPLFKAAGEKPSMILVAEEEFLPIRKEIDIPVLWVGKHAESARVLGPADNVNDHIVTSASGSFEPIIVATHFDYRSELPEARSQLAEVLAEANILEPFERIRVALEHVHHQKA